jgi:hypothetical protein
MEMQITGQDDENHRTREEKANKVHWDIGEGQNDQRGRSQSLCIWLQKSQQAEKTVADDYQ